MTILVTGGTGITGQHLLSRLAQTGLDVRATSRTPETALFPDKVVPVKAGFNDIPALRRALKDVSVLFLLVPNSATELTDTLNILSLAREAGVRGIVYLSVFACDSFLDTPHIVCKQAIERMITRTGLPATVLHCAFFMQNDARRRDALLQQRIYDTPLGHKGVAMIDCRDIAEIAASEILRRHQSDAPLPAVTHDIVGPENFTGPDIAAIWTELLGEDIAYEGDDLEAFEAHMQGLMPDWFAFDLRLMFTHYWEHGTPASTAQMQHTEALLGRPLRTYRDFAQDIWREWKVD